jgi:hypothetical protein
MAQRLPRVQSVLSSTFVACAAAVPAALPAILAHPPSPLASGGLIFALSLAAGVIQHERRESYRLDRQRYFLERICRPVLEDLRSQDATARMNVMLVRWSLFGRRLEPFWGCHMDGCNDSSLTLSMGQGVSGAACTEGDWVVGDFENNLCSVGNKGETFRDPNRNMRQDQRDACADLKLIFSYPVRRLKRAGSVGNVTPVADVIGLINIDSRMPGALQFYTGNGHYKTLTGKVLPDIATVAGYLLS